MTKKPKWRSILFLSLALLAASLIMACGEPTSPPWPTIAAGTSIFSFNAQQGGPNPSNQTLSVWNAGDGTLSWSASDNADWLILSPTNGSSTGEIDNIFRLSRSI